MPSFMGSLSYAGDHKTLIARDIKGQINISPLPPTPMIFYFIYKLNKNMGKKKSVVTRIHTL